MFISFFATNYTNFTNDSFREIRVIREILTKFFVGNFGNDDVAFVYMGGLGEEGGDVGVGVMHILSRGGAGFDGVRDAARGRFDIVREGNRGEGVDGGELIVQFPAQIFGFGRGQFEGGKFDEVVKQFGGNFFRHGSPLKEEFGGGILSFSCRLRVFWFSAIERCT